MLGSYIGVVVALLLSIAKQIFLYHQKIFLTLERFGVCFTDGKLLIYCVDYFSYFVVGLIGFFMGWLIHIYIIRLNKSEDLRTKK